jgi:hypothetical protein
MSNEDLPPVQNIAQWDAAVILPLVQDLEVVDEDDEVVGATLVEDLGGGVVGTRHFGWFNWKYSGVFNNLSKLEK